MSVSAGHLDELMGQSIAAADFGGLAVDSFSLANDGTVASLGVTATGSPWANVPAELGLDNLLYKVSDISNTDNTISIDEYLLNQQTGDFDYVSTTTYAVIGFNSDAMVIATGTNAGVADGLKLNQVVDQSLAAVTASPLAADTSFAVFNDRSFNDTLPCFTPGTRIRTARGEVAVETICAGDAIVGEVSGLLRGVRWTGRRTVNVAAHPRPWDVAPVRVRADAFAPGQPHCDLILSPDHAVQVGGVLVPIRYLLNGATIAQEFPDSVTYLHVELDAHDVLLAEGLPCESYLDTGNRAAFANAAGPVQLQPDFARAVWAAQGCLPLRLDGREVVAEKRRLLARAKVLGWRRTREPALHVLADGHPVAAERHGAEMRVLLPPGTAELHLLSRSVVPAEGRAGAKDGRRLGVAIAGLRLDGAEPPDACFAGGWHAEEEAWRWTDGAALLRIAGAREVRFVVVGSETYWRGAPSQPRGSRQRMRAA